MGRDNQTTSGAKNCGFLPRTLCSNLDADPRYRRVTPYARGMYLQLAAMAGRGADMHCAHVRRELHISRDRVWGDTMRELGAGDNPLVSVENFIVVVRPPVGTPVSVRNTENAKKRWGNPAARAAAVVSTLREARPAAKVANEIQTDFFGLNDAINAGSKAAIAEAKALAKMPAATRCPHGQIVALYHEICTDLPRVSQWTEARKMKLQKRWHESPERQRLEFWRKLFQTVHASNFLNGRTAGERPFQATLPWLIQSEETLLKVAEGAYSRNGNAAHSLFGRGEEVRDFQERPSVAPRFPRLVGT